MEYYGEHNADTLSPEQFFDNLLYLTSKKIISEEYIQNNQNFFNSVLEDMYDSYLDGASISSLSTILENLFYNLFKYKPKL